MVTFLIKVTRMLLTQQEIVELEGIHISIKTAALG